MNLLHLNYYSHLLRYSRNVSRAVSTPKLSKILSVFDTRISSPNTLRKATILSAHDTDVFPMLAAMNFSSHTCIEELYRFGKTTAINCQPGPEYASNIIWELHKEQGTYLVRVKSNGKYMGLCETSATQCAYDEWKGRVQRVIIDVTELCPPPK